MLTAQSLGTCGIGLALYLQVDAEGFATSIFSFPVWSPVAMSSFLFSTNFAMTVRWAVILDVMRESIAFITLQKSIFLSMSFAQLLPSTLGTLALMCAAGVPAILVITENVFEGLAVAALSAAGMSVVMLVLASTMLIGFLVRWVSATGLV